VNIEVVSFGSPLARITRTTAATARWYEPGSSASTVGSLAGPDGAMEMAAIMVLLLRLVVCGCVPHGRMVT
jgi:hypothetical protein